MPPKPLLMPFTVGHRRTPVLQSGADVYCDTQKIIVLALAEVTENHQTRPIKSVGCLLYSSIVRLRRYRPEQNMKLSTEYTRVLGGTLSIKQDKFGS